MRPILVKLAGGISDFLRFVVREDVFTVLVFALAYLFLVLILRVDLLFSNTVVTGGDMGSHVYAPQYLREIFPLVRWWSPDWYSGFPFLYFYPPLMFSATALLSFLIPLNIAFKLIIFSAVIIFPVGAYFTMKWLKLKFPIPQLAVIFSLFLVFLEEYSIYGGNLASLLAGQFSHTMSIALIFLFIGLMYRGVTTGRYLRWNMLLGTAVMLTHPVSALVLIMLIPFFLFQTADFKKNFWYALKAYSGIFLLSAFWSLGFLFYKSYSGYMDWNNEVVWTELFPPHWLFLTIPAALAVLLAAFKRARNLVVFFGLIFVCAIFYFFLTGSNIWNNRFLPYLSLSILLLAAYLYGTLWQVITKRFRKIGAVLLLGLLFFSIYTLKVNIEFVPSWFKWNFEGYEAKGSWAEVDGLFQYLKGLPKGEVLWEYQPDFEKYGTTRVLETVPFFTGQPTFEGLLVDSALTSPFHFINQSETTDKATSAIAGFEYPPFDFSKGVRHMKVSGAIYFVAYSDLMKEKAAEEADLEKMKEVGPFSVYRVRDSHLVDTISAFSVSLKDKDWLSKSIEWYKGEDLEYPIVFAKDQAEFDRLSDIADQDQNWEITSPDNIIFSNDSIEFDTVKIGQPHIVKTTYFPTWKVKGAEGPYLISPAYMMVIPTESHVKLYFSYGWIDWLGMALTILGVVWLSFFKRINTLLAQTVVWSRRKSLSR